ncbi:DEKNAAC101513 [Brettanomyces naardenensis]|uniref:DEKNAAC101513 n=1 Tax=Brettanomyces naardenensis TaxID=13370 RepID=A0A448YI26_BRENA|nr:DEKNAAC101513 [Brettanomyces naardenensis]
MAEEHPRYPNKKRKYSRNGCKECRRRKLKCDEGKPGCWNCVHLHKVCVYEKRIKFTTSRSFTVDSGNSARVINFDANEDTDGSNVSPSPSSIPSTTSLPTTLPTGLPTSLPTSHPTSYVFASPFIPPGQQNEVNDSLFTGASNVISDLNHMIQHFNFDFGFGLSDMPGRDVSEINYPAISPIPVNQDQPYSNDKYIRKLTKSLDRYGVGREGLARSDTAPETDPSQGNSSSMDTGSSHVRSPTIETTNLSQLDSRASSAFAASLTNSPQVDSEESMSANSPQPIIILPPNSEHLNSTSSPSVSSPSSGSSSSSSTPSSFPPPKLSILLSQSPDRFDYLNSLNSTITEKDLISLAKYFNWTLNSSHVNYLKTFVTKIHMNFLPFTTTFLNNAYINCFLSKAKEAPHLLFAMLAIAARYEIFEVESKDSNPVMLKYHRRFRSYYLSSCLKSLDSIMHSKFQILNNIESLLMTILVLASDYSGTKGSEWRAHLKGAKDLLVRYCKFRPISLELVIVWLWFYSMETLAGLTAYNGGTIHDFSELQDFLGVVKSTDSNMGVALRRSGFLIGGYRVDDSGNPIFDGKSRIVGGDGDEGAEEEDQEPSNDDNQVKSSPYIVISGQRIRKLVNYNLYVGYNDDAIDVFNDIVVALECSRRLEGRGGVKGDSNDKRIDIVLNSKGRMRNEYLMNLLSKISKARSFTIMNNKLPYRIPIDSPYHPLNLKGYHYNNPLGVNIVMSGYIHDTNDKTRSSDDRDNWYSWFDLSQQLYVDAAFVRVLSTKLFFTVDGLGIKDSMVQDVIERMLSGLSCLVKFRDDLEEQDWKDLDAYYNGRGEDVDSGAEEDVDQGELERDDEGDLEGVVDESISAAPTAAPNGISVIVKEKELTTDKDIVKNKLSMGKKKIEFERYLYYRFDNRLVMVQWPLFMCGLCCVEPKQKLIVDCCFNALMSLGVGSSEIILMRLMRIWRFQKQGKFDYYRQDLFDDGNDSVPFT